MGRTKWTRDEIIRQILQSDADGLTLSVVKGGIDHKLYQAGSRFFGSWANALCAAGVSPKRGNCGKKWPPPRILSIIRSLYRRRKPLTLKEIVDRYTGLVAAARRLFGSWYKAVVAAGVDPVRLRRVQPWTRERTIEAILIRSLSNEPLTPAMSVPRSLVNAGRKHFGKWSSALQTAGIDEKEATMRPAQKAIPERKRSNLGAQMRNGTKESVLVAIQSRLQEKKPLRAKSVIVEDYALHRAAKYHFGCWRDALFAAGILSIEHRFGPRPTHASSQEDQRLETDRIAENPLL